MIATARCSHTYPHTYQRYVHTKEMLFQFLASVDRHTLTVRCVSTSMSTTEKCLHSSVSALMSSPQLIRYSVEDNNNNIHTQNSVRQGKLNPNFLHTGQESSQHKGSQTETTPGEADWNWEETSSANESFHTDINCLKPFSRLRQLTASKIGLIDMQSGAFIAFCFNSLSSTSIVNK